MIMPNVLNCDWIGRGPRLRSGRVTISEETIGRVSIERCKSRIEAAPRPAVGTEDRVRLGHINVDVRVVPRWGHAYALEFPPPDADFGKAAIVSELRIAAARRETSLHPDCPRSLPNWSGKLCASSAANWSMVDSHQ
jgi:hypothetical protein